MIPVPKRPVNNAPPRPVNRHAVADSKIPMRSHGPAWRGYGIPFAEMRFKP